MILSSGDTTDERPGILYLDLEGGWGGSSRSLYYLVEALDRTRFRPVVVLRKKGPIQARYESLGVPCRVANELPAFRPAERKNAISFGLFALHLRKFDALVRLCRDLTRTHGIKMIHVNHESLAVAGNLLARRLGLPWIGHVRSQLLPGWYSRRVYRLMARRAAHLIFIVEPGREHFRTLAGKAYEARRTSVLHNIMPVPKRPPEPLESLARPEDAFRVISLANFSPNRGIDRILDVATALKKRGATGIVFSLCGQPAHRNVATGRPSSYYESLLHRIESERLGNFVRLPGHVAEPERALAASHALIKLTREANPWGRDIMEALAAGLPVITLGGFQDFVENGTNGYIRDRFDPEDIAAWLTELAADPLRRGRIAQANRDKARHLFDGANRAREVEAIYGSVLRASDPRHLSTSTAA